MFSKNSKIDIIYLKHGTLFAVHVWKRFLKDMNSVSTLFDKKS